MSSPVKFFRKKLIRLPWQPATPLRVEEGEVEDHLAWGSKLSVQGPHQSTPLPLRSKQDLAEFQSFRKGEIDKKLDHKNFANDLLLLQNGGAKFYAELNQKNEEVGAYGAYNYLAGKSSTILSSVHRLGIDALEVAFGQAVPKLKIDGVSDFEQVMERAKFVESLVERSPEKLRGRHRSLLLEAAFANLEEKNKLNLANKAATLLEPKAWPAKGKTLGILQALFQDFMIPKNRALMVFQVAGATESTGKKKLKNFSSALALFRAACQAESSPADFYRQVLKNCHQEDHSYLKQSLAQVLFPKLSQKVDELTEFCSQETKSESQNHLLQTLIAHPEVKEPRNLLLLNYDRLKASEENEGSLATNLEFSLKYLSKTHFEAKYALTLSKSEKIANASEIMEMSLRSDSLEEFEQALNGSQALPPDFSQKDILDPLIRDSVKSVRLKQVVSKIVHANDSNNRSMLTSLGSKWSLIEASSRADSSELELLQNALASCHPDDELYLCQTLGEELFPEQLSTAQELTKASPKESKAKDLQVTLATIINNPEISDSLQLSLLTLDQLKAQNASLVRQVEFARWSADSRAATNGLAKFAATLLDTNTPEGEALIEGESARLALLEASLRSPNDVTTFSQVAVKDQGDWRRRFLQKLMLETFYPEQEKLIQDWTQFSAPDFREGQQDVMRALCLADEEISNPMSLLRKTTERFEQVAGSEEILDDLYDSLLRTQPKSQKVSLALKLKNARTNDNWKKLKAPSSVYKICEASLDPDINFEQFLETAIESANYDEEDSIREEILRQVYPKRLQAMEALLGLAEKGDKRKLFEYLSRAAIAGSDQESAEQLAKRAITQIPETHQNIAFLRHKLHHLGAKYFAKENEQARILVDLAESVTSSDRYNLRSQDARDVLFKLALQADLSREEIFDRIAEQTEQHDRKFIFKSLAEEFYPKVAEQVEALTFYARPEQRRKLWHILFETAYKHPKTQDPVQLVRKVIHESEEGSYSDALRLLALKKTQSKNKQSKFALALTQDNFGDSILYRGDSISSLYQAALESHASPMAFLERAFEGCQEMESPALRRALGTYLMEESNLEPTEDILNSIEDGEFSLDLLREVYETLQMAAQKETPDMEIGTEDDLIHVGDEILEVDL